MEPALPSVSLGGGVGSLRWLGSLEGSQVMPSSDVPALLTPHLKVSSGEGSA